MLVLFFAKKIPILLIKRNLPTIIQTIRDFPTIISLID